MIIYFNIIIIYDMKISKQMILNNYEWFKNNQIVNDIIKLLGFDTQFNDAYIKINNNNLFDKFNIDDIDDIDMSYIKKNKNRISHEYKGIFDLFYQMNKMQINKDTYLPNLYGLILISQ
jgi:hypothetical protein